MNEELKIELENEEGQKLAVNIIAKFDDGENDYVIGQDYNDTGKNYIFKLESDPEYGEKLISIDDEKEYERLQLIANKIILEEIQ